MKTAFDWDRFRALPLVGIIRFKGDIDYPHFVDAVVTGGLTTIEVSFTYPGAADHIAKLRAAAGDRLNIGAGTITTPGRLANAREAGASFVVTPYLVPTVMAGCKEAQLPVFPGAFTPTEIAMADLQGAAMVKLFPAVSLGPGFVSQLKAALPEVRLLPTGGIGLAEIPAWKRAGADGLGLGGGLFPAELLQRQAWSELAQHIRRHADAWRAP